jgi:hypothetical protein
VQVPNLVHAPRPRPLVKGKMRFIGAPLGLPANVASRALSRIYATTKKRARSKRGTVKEDSIAECLVASLTPPFQPRRKLPRTRNTPRLCGVPDKRADIVTATVTGPKS